MNKSILNIFLIPFLPLNSFANEILMTKLDRKEALEIFSQYQVIDSYDMDKEKIVTPWEVYMTTSGDRDAQAQNSKAKMLDFFMKGVNKINSFYIPKDGGDIVLPGTIISSFKNICIETGHEYETINSFENEGYSNYVDYEYDYFSDTYINLNSHNSQKLSFNKALGLKQHAEINSKKTRLLAKQDVKYSAQFLKENSISNQKIWDNTTNKYYVYDKDENYNRNYGYQRIIPHEYCKERVVLIQSEMEVQILPRAIRENRSQELTSKFFNMLVSELERKSQHVRNVFSNHNNEMVFSKMMNTDTFSVGADIIKNTCNKSKRIFYGQEEVSYSECLVNLFYNHYTNVSSEYIVALNKVKSFSELHPTLTDIYRNEKCSFSSHFDEAEIFFKYRIYIQDGYDYLKIPFQYSAEEKADFRFRKAVNGIHPSKSYEPFSRSFSPVIPLAKWKQECVNQI